MSEHIDIRAIDLSTRPKYKDCIFFDSCKSSSHPNVTFSYRKKDKIIFQDCIFNIDKLEFNEIADNRIIISFINCQFKSEINICVQECFSILFKEVKAKSLILSYPNLKHLASIVKLDFWDDFECGKVTISNIDIKTLRVRNTTINKLEMLTSHFRNARFFNNIIGSLTLTSVKFNDLTFVDNKIKNLQLNHITILSDINLINKNYRKTELLLSYCTIKGISRFDDSFFYKLLIHDTTFEKSVSFQNVTVDSIDINKSNFQGKSFFDDFNILSPKPCSRKTIRTIKNQLQLQNNQIDYSRFKVLELDRYKDELKYKESLVDKTILTLYSWMSDYGTNWIKAVKNLIMVGLGIYIIFFLVYNFNADFNLNYTNEFLRGLFRFFLITDYYDPLSVERVFFTKWYHWIPFIIGKIFIAFGIYETIQSFRKFKT